MGKTVRIDLLSHAHHLNQPLTGYYLWAKKNGFSLDIRDCSRNNQYSIKKTALIAYIDDQRLVYDMSDGYRYLREMEYLLDRCDAYFKRSYSEEENTKMGYKNVFPYGLNYNVTWLGNPLLRYKKGGVFHIGWELINGTLKTPHMIEKRPFFQLEPTVLFMTRLWPEEPSLTGQENEERRIINKSRVEVIKALKKNFGERFVGGLVNNRIAEKEAPEFILHNKKTNRNAYIHTMQHCDICISTTGLHGSIGGKLGEYVAASRAIVTEPLRYSVPGDFTEKCNYLEFNSVDQCVEQVDQLMKYPETLHQIQRNNYEYYQHYLRPDRLIQNTLDIVGIKGLE